MGKVKKKHFTSTAQHSVGWRVMTGRGGTVQTRPGTAEPQHEKPEGGPRGPRPLIPGDVAGMREVKGHSYT